MRADMLIAVKKAHPAGASDLAAEFGLTTNAVRRHLEELETAGLVHCVPEVRGVGAPRLG